MSAHLRSLVDSCQEVHCDKRAVVQLFTTRNEPYGRYCRRCGDRRLKEQLAREAKS